jgi:Skp family chaperone for outer membrane proteins
MISKNLKYNLQMKPKVLFLLAFVSLLTWSTFAQRSIRIGYIDTEYILENIPEYQDASSQLDAKVLKWKSEIDERLNKIQQKKDQLNSESVLLTKELVEERQEEITVEELDILDYQQKRFGPNGDLMIQKKSLIQPIQDQIFSAVQEIAANKSYDFVFDKSADVVMLYSAERFDISEQVLRSINRTSRRTQAETKAERKAAEEEEIIPDVDLEKEAEDQEIADKKAAREKAVTDRRTKAQEAREAKKQELEDKKKKILEDRAKAREEKLNARKGDDEDKDVATKKDSTSVKTDSTSTKTPPSKTEKKLSDREARKKALEDKKKKILEARKKAQEEKLKNKKKQDSTNNNN